LAITSTYSGKARPLSDHLVAIAKSWRPAHYALLLLVHIELLASWNRAGTADWYDFIYPWADALRDTLLKYHQFPWWNPFSMSGQPFLAEPQTAVLTPDALFIVLFGATLGFKLIILFYTMVGYEGSRFLCRHLFGKSRFVEGASIIPALIPALALHLRVGHAVLVSFWLFPWLLALALTWRDSSRRAVALGAVAGCYFLTYVHYSLIISFTIAGTIVAVQIAQRPRSRDVWLKAALVATTALGIGLTRIALTASFVAGFPRAETMHYPIVGWVGSVIRWMIDPFQKENDPKNIADLHHWELGSYVGLLAVLLALHGLRSGDRRQRFLHLGAVVCLVLAWNNRDKYLPGYWMHVLPPWKTMVVITRWRLFACYFILLGAVQGLVAIRSTGRRRLAVGLAALVVLDLGLSIFGAYRGAFDRGRPPFVRTPDPPRTVRDSAPDVWRDYRANLISMGSEFPLLGWHDHYPNRAHIGTPGYAGDYTGTRPVVVEHWSPNRIVLRGAPGDTLTININPSSYWLLNGRRLFPQYRAMEPDLPFRLVVPPTGRVELTARPPHLALFLALQASFALVALLLYRRLRASVTWVLRPRDSASKNKRAPRKSVPTVQASPPPPF
jgi:hypothetical protein